MPVKPTMSEEPKIPVVIGGPMNGLNASIGPWSDNILIAMDAGLPHDKIFGSSIERADIKSIIFVDSFETKPFFGEVDVSADGSGKVFAWTKIRRDGFYDLYIGGNGGVAANANSQRLFSNYINVEQIQMNGNFHTENATTVNAMFYGCKSLTSVDVSGFVTSKVTNMDNMFYGCESLKNVDVRGFDISSVTSMGGMFYHCKSLTSLDVRNFTSDQIAEMAIPEGVTVYR